jgi:hypothetical protein
VVNWPGTGINSALRGPGAVLNIDGDNPAAGAEISVTVPQGVRWRLCGIRFDFQTSAVVANRNVHVFIDDGVVTELMRVCAPSVQAAGVTVWYMAGPFGFDRIVTGGVALVSLPINLLLKKGWRIRVQAIVMDPSDNFGPPHLTVEEWIEA